MKTIQIGDRVAFDTSADDMHERVEFHKSDDDIRYGSWFGEIIEVSGMDHLGPPMALAKVTMYPTPPEQDDGLREISAQFAIYTEKFEWGEDELSENAWVAKK